MRTFTLKEVSKKINVKTATLKKWEEDLEEYLEIPRTKQGARIYSQVEIDLLLEIKALHDKRLNTTMILKTLRGETDIKEVISELEDESFQPEEVDIEREEGIHLHAEEVDSELKEGIHLHAEEVDTELEDGIHLHEDVDTELEEVMHLHEEVVAALKEETSEKDKEVHEPAAETSEPKDEINNPETQELAIFSHNATPVSDEEIAIKSADEFFLAMDTYKQTFLNEVKEEIRNVLRKEVVEEVKKEIATGTNYTVNSLSESINQSTATTKAELKELSVNLDKNAEQTTDRLLYLSKSIANASHETSEEIYILSKQLSKSTEELAHYVEITNTEISGLSDTIEKDREDRGKERDLLRHDITQREAAFQNFLTSFRDVAAAKEKKWWKFWE